MSGIPNEMCENFIDFDNAVENVSWAGVNISWEMEMDAVICTAIAVQPLLPSLGSKYLQIQTSAVSNLEIGRLYPVGFGSECKEGKAYKDHTAVILYSFYCGVLLSLNDIESLGWLTKKKKKIKKIFIPISC